MAADPAEDPSGLWAGASTFPDLLSLTQRFLRGEPIGFPGWATSETDDESDDMQPTLLAANEAGLLSVASQPGAAFGPGHDDLTWGGRAFVGGFAEPASAAVIQERAKQAGLWAKDGDKDGPFVIPAGLRDGTPYLLLGADAKAHELELFEDRVGPGALAALESATFLWVIDPAWGRRERLSAAFDSAGF